MDKLNCFSLTMNEHVAHLVLNRPEAMNTMGPTFWKELDAVLKHLHKATDHPDTKHQTDKAASSLTVYRT